MSLRERPERIDDVEQACQHELEAVAHDEHVGVVGDERAGGSEMEIGAGIGCLLAERVHVCHDVVAEAQLECRGRIEVGIVEMGSHRGDRGRRDRQAKFPLGLGEREPDSAPLTDAMRLTPQALHRRRCVASGERRLPAVAGH